MGLSQMLNDARISPFTNKILNPKILSVVPSVDFFRFCIFWQPGHKTNTFWWNFDWNPKIQNQTCFPFWCGVQCRRWPQLCRRDDLCDAMHDVIGNKAKWLMTAIPHFRSLYIPQRMYPPLRNRFMPACQNVLNTTMQGPETKDTQWNMYRVKPKPR